MSLPVLTAVTGSWEAPLVAGLEGAPHGVHVVRRCVDLAELLAAAAAGLARAVLVSADLERLDVEAVAALRFAGVAVIALVDPMDGDAPAQLLALGVRHVVAADAGPPEVAAAVAAAVTELASAPPTVLATRRRPTAMTADPADALGPPPPLPPASLSAASASTAPPAGSGKIVAVWGPTGAPGRTTVAVTLAAEFAAMGMPVLLADVDTYGPCIAQTLGLLDESAGIGAAVRAANLGQLDLVRLAKLTPVVSPGLRVLTGLSRSSRWPELRPSALEVVWQRARDLATWTVLDCGFSLEQDEELSFDTTAPRRNGATLSALTVADVVVVVGAADPVGLQRLVRALSDLRETGPAGVQPRVVVTKVRASAVGPEPQRRVSQALKRYAGVHEVVLIPDDRAACDAAMLAGRSLTEHAPASAARIALCELAIDLMGGRTPAAVPQGRRARKIGRR